MPYHHFPKSKAPVHVGAASSKALGSLRIITNCQADGRRNFTTDVHVTTSTPLYAYETYVLWAAYGTALAVAIVANIMGTWAMAQNKVAYSPSFITWLIMTWGVLDRQRARRASTPHPPEVREQYVGVVRGEDGRDAFAMQEPLPRSPGTRGRRWGWIWGRSRSRGEGRT